MKPEDTALSVIHRGRYVLTGEAPPIVDGAVLLDGSGRVCAVDTAERLRAMHPDVRTDPHDAVLIPGLVNAYVSTRDAVLQGAVPGGAGLTAWLDARDRAWRVRDTEMDDTARLRALDALVTAGTVAVADVATSGTARDDLVRRGLQGIVLREVRVTGTAMDLPTRVHPTEGEHSHGLVSVLAPDSLVPFTEAQIARLAALAREAKHPFFLPLCQHAEERAFLRDRRGPLMERVERLGIALDGPITAPSPLDAAERLGLLAPGTVLIHLTDATRAELDAIASHGAAVVLCPRAALYIQTRLPPLLDVLAAGVRPALGSSSPASNTTLDVMAEALALRARFPTVATQTLFAMATAWGADVLARPDLGRLAVGCTPGLVAVDARTMRGSDPFDHVIASTPAMRRTLVKSARDPQ